MKLLRNFLPTIFIIFQLSSYAQHTGEWAWITGSLSPAQPTVWGTKGVPAAGNTPGARYESMEWTDTAGNFWVFGGWPISPTPFAGHNGDLWKFDPVIKQWAWMHGTQTPFTFPVYGTQGVAAPGNMPAAACAVQSAVDKNGNLWLPVTSNENVWKYSTNTNMWTWTKGKGNTWSSFPKLGTKGVFSATNTPQTQYADNACSWGCNNFIYTYNGFHKTNGQNVGVMWKYDITTDQYAWIAGDTINGSVYGIQGVASAQTQPGVYQAHARWVGGDGNLYMMGGIESPGRLSNSLWKFDPAIDQWSWMGGTPGAGTVGNYGMMGVASPTNWPGSRIQNRATWVDKCGNLWLHGGMGYGANASNIGYLNDVWMYCISSGMWTWKGGSGIKNISSFAGAQNIFSLANQPSGRNGGNGFVDKAGNFWLFGGADTAGFLNDLWMLNTQPSISSTNATACLSADGQASVKVFIGEAPYTYVWSSGQTTASATLTGLTAGNYSVTIIDAGGCLQQDTVTITAGPNTLASSTTSTIVACVAQANVSIAGGNSPFTYSWNNGSTLASIIGIPQGIYNASVTDKNGCVQTGSVSVPATATVTASATRSDIICNGQLNGSATIIPAGGSGNYIYTWSNGNTNDVVSTLAAGVYTVTVTDQNNCTAQTQVIISQPSALVLNPTIIPDTCGSASGSLLASVSGGTGLYQYSWSSGNTNNYMDHLLPGKYFVTITDSLGCVHLDSAIVNSINPLQAIDSTSLETCDNTRDATSSVFIQLGHVPYTYRCNRQWRYCAVQLFLDT